MTAKHTFSMTDEFEDQRNGNLNYTTVHKTFYADHLDDLAQEFTHYLWHLGYTYVDHVEVVKAK